LDQYLRDYLHDTKDDWNYITPADFYNQYFGKKHYLLIDLRDKASFDKGPAKNVSDLLCRSHQLPGIGSPQTSGLRCHGSVKDVPVAAWLSHSKQPKETEATHTQTQNVTNYRL